MPHFRCTLPVTTCHVHFDCVNRETPLTPTPGQGSAGSVPIYRPAVLRHTCPRDFVPSVTDEDEWLTTTIGAFRRLGIFHDSTTALDDTENFTVMDLEIRKSTLYSAPRVVP